MIKCIIVVCLLVFVFDTRGTDGYDYTTHYITVPVDHFSFTNDTFELKYLMNDTYWDIEKGPIFFYVGSDRPIEMCAENAGFVWEIASEFEALIVFAEHRYYGESKPYGAQTFGDPEHLSYLTSQQALADFKDLIEYLQNKDSKLWFGMQPPERPNPVIAFGGSYGGILVAWFSMKYPGHVSGAIASSAPIQYLNGMAPCDSFYKITTEVYKHENAKCASTISASWRAINHVTETGHGKKWLTDNWRLCRRLKNDNDVWKLKRAVETAYVALAMVNYLSPLPAYPIKEVCKFMTNHAVDDRTLLTNVFRGLNVYFNYTGSAKCMDLSSTLPKDNVLAWKYQDYSELTWPMCKKGCEDDMFEMQHWDVGGWLCRTKYYGTPVEKQYSGRNLKNAFRIIFSNGQLDPWYDGGLLKSISSSVKALVIPHAAHQMDLRAAHPNDPPSVINARQSIQRSIKEWIHEYRIKQLMVD